MGGAETHPRSLNHWSHKNGLHRRRGGRVSWFQASADFVAHTLGQEYPFVRIIIDLGLTGALVTFGGAIVLPGLGHAINLLYFDSLNLGPVARVGGGGKGNRAKSHSGGNSGG